MSKEHILLPEKVGRYLIEKVHHESSIKNSGGVRQLEQAIRTVLYKIDFSIQYKKIMRIYKMRILLLAKQPAHHKNQAFLSRCTKIQFTVAHTIHDRDDVDSFDAVMSMTEPIDVSLYPGQRFIFGPQFSVFPNETQLNIIKGSKTIYNLLDVRRQ